jgi:small subunit ribosomal protein S4e
MANKGSNNHIKRLAANKYLKIAKKSSAYVVKPNPGRHTKVESIALITVIKEKMNMAANSKEAIQIIKSGSILVNGKKIKEASYPIGYGDRLHLVSSNSDYVVDSGRYGTFSIREAKATDLDFFKVTGKYISKNAKLMIRLHNGRIIAATKDVMINDSVTLDESSKIKKVFKFEVGAKCKVYKGVRAPANGEIISITEGNALNEKSVGIKTGSESFITVARNVIITGGA